MASLWSQPGALPNAGGAAGSELRLEQSALPSERPNVGCKVAVLPAESLRFHKQPWVHSSVQAAVYLAVGVFAIKPILDAKSPTSRSPAVSSPCLHPDATLDTPHPCDPMSVHAVGDVFTHT
ncbi:hypothetical protein MG293_019903 [Ovis ammon polii]|uniref:Uncharacterized protein n=1 Tax=Ovis ammon polii TaxID=230172 RepID=A0AAD4TP00_OVIAM|nr:hypothetical protein MG293_019903 [Ovis ammon polii]